MGNQSVNQWFSNIVSGHNLLQKRGECNMVPVLVAGRAAFLAIFVSMRTTSSNSITQSEILSRPNSPAANKYVIVAIRMRVEFLSFEKANKGRYK